MHRDLQISHLSRFVVVLLGLAVANFITSCDGPREPTPDESTPILTQPPVVTSGSISGVVWHDLCMNLTQTDKAQPGCIAVGDAGGYVANGIQEEGEPGIGSMQVFLGEGGCPSKTLSLTTTTADGRFVFSDVTPGVYCVSVDVSNHQPGVWTYPEMTSGTGAGLIMITLGSGEIRENVNFGWDYLMLPATPTPEPGDAPIPSPSCTDKASFIKDVTIPDGTHLPPEETFEKVWRIENSGSCTWTSEYSLVFVSGYSLGGPDYVPLLGDVPPGSIVDIAVGLEAPKYSGVYKGYWMLLNPDNILFGIGDDARNPFFVKISTGPKPAPEITAWRGDYYDNRKLEGDPVLVRNDEEINFKWEYETPADDVPADNFSVRWTRELTFDAGIHRFSLRFDDGARLIVDGQLVIDEWEDGSERMVGVDLWMSKGEHDLEVDFYEHSSYARVNLNIQKLTSPSYEGWRGEFWFSRQLTSQWALIRGDEKIDFDWGEGSPTLGIPSNNFSVRWDRWVDFEPGVYRFFAQADDGIRIYVDGGLIINEWHDSSGSKVYSAELTLTGSHELEIEYYEHGGSAKVTFYWRKESPLNEPPGALVDAYNVDEDVVLNVTAPGVLENDIDVDQDPLSAVLESEPNHGDVTLNEDGSFTYSPYLDFYGTDSFTYRASDGSAVSGAASVEITVNPIDDQPVAVEDNVETHEDTPVEIDVLGNDTGLGDTPISVIIADLPLEGTVEVLDHNIKYTPGANFNGTNSFSYAVIDADNDSATATVAVMVDAVNDPPEALDDNYSVDEDSILDVESPGVLDNDSDLEGDILTAVLESGVTGGSLTLNGDGSFTYVPASDFNGTDSFTYKANDGSESSSVAIVTITVNPINDMPAAMTDNVELEGIVPVLIDVLGNDDGLGDAPIIVAVMIQPGFGVAEVVDNQIQYTPGDGFEGLDSFSYSVTDADEDSSTATVTVISAMGVH
jgi:VCBS repeat-containing protein